MKTMIIRPIRLFGPATTPAVIATSGVKNTTNMAVAMSPPPNSLTSCVSSLGGTYTPTLFYFHKIMEINITEKDQRGSSPLHWAIFSMSELAMVYILAWLKVDQLAQKDDEGFTAMHLAIKITEKLESTRPVRSLIYNGAPTNIADKDGNFPIDLAR